MRWSARTRTGSALRQRTTLYLRPYMFATGPVIGVKPSMEYQFRLFAAPVGLFQGRRKALTICVSGF